MIKFGTFLLGLLAVDIAYRVFARERVRRAILEQPSVLAAWTIRDEQAYRQAVAERAMRQ